MKRNNIENQKIIKHFAAIFVIATIVVTSVLPVLASDDNILYVSSIDFDDGNGNSVQSLDGLSKVRAQVTVKTKNSQKMVFVLALYGKNNKLLKIDREAKRATSSGTAFEATVEYDIPGDAADYKLNAFLLDNAKDMNAIARGSLFPSGNLDLCNLFVTIGDNEPVDLLVAGQAKDGVYKVDVPLDTEFTPVVKAVALDNGTKVQVTPPTFFPGYTDIKLTATNGATQSYRVEYVAKSTINSLTGYVGTNFHAADDTTEDYGSVYYNDRATPVYNGSDLAYYNDVRSISDDWDYLKGSIYYKASVGDYSNPSYKSDRSTTVRVFGTSAITGDGWTSQTNDEGHITVSHTTGAGVEDHTEYKEALKMSVVSSRTFPAGTVTITGIPKNFLVVVEPAQYISEEYRAFSTESIMVNGDYIDTTDGPGTYSVRLPSDIVFAPEITEEDIAFSEEYDNRVVEITNPTSFPGQSVIKITAGESSAEYVFNYTVDSLITNASSNMGTNFHAADDLNATETSDKATPVTTFKKGSQLYADRADSGLLYQGYYQYFNDIRTISDEWDYLNGTDFFMSAVSNNRTATFTLNRDAVVRVFSLGSNAMSVADGWTLETDINGYMTASTTAGQGLPEGYNPHTSATNDAVFTYMFCKSFGAGETVTVTPAVKESITVIDYLGYIGDKTLLSDITVNGESLADFNISRKEYEVEIDASTRIVPEVIATPMVPDSEVEIINPTTFPGKAVIKVINGDKESEYTITYITGELISNASRAVGKNFHAADGESVGSQLYSDRSCPTYVGNSAANGVAYYNDIRAISDDWSYLSGTDYFMSAVAAGSRSVTFTLNRAAVVRVFSQGTAAMSTADGWIRETNDNGYMAVSTTSGQMTAETSSQFTNMFYKQFNAGDEVTVAPTAKESITVIDYAGYGEQIEEVEEMAALTDISIDGVSIAGFNMDTTDYAYEIAPDTVVIPEITVTALVDGSEIEIINPGEGDNPNVFPGKSIVIVRLGDDEREYTIDYTYTALSAITDMSSSNGGSFFAGNFHEPGDFGETYGSKLFYDRSSPMMSGSSVAYYNDIREICDDLDYLKGTDYIMANRNLRGSVSHTFTLVRPAMVRVLHQAQADVSSFSGWTTETNADGYVKLSHSTGAGVEGHESYQDPQPLDTMTYKAFDAGDTVSVNPPGNIAIVVIDYAGYEVE